MTTLRAGAATDVGRVRQINEDRFLSDEILFAVADGVGGHQAGEVASQTSVETLQRAFAEGQQTTEGLITAAEAANQAVWHLAQTSQEKRGMGTTLTALALVGEGGDEQLALINVGDSRAYILKRGELVQLTEDHSLVEELIRDGKLSRADARVHPQRSIITRALGMDPTVQVDSWPLTPYRGDRFLLCSDGLTNELSDERIASTLRHLADPQEAAHDLVRQARAAGGGDNITVVVVDVVEDGGRAEQASAALAGSPTQPSRRGPDLPPTPIAEIDLAHRSAWVAAPSTGASSPPPLEIPKPSLVPPPPRARRFTWRVAVFFLAIIAVLGTAVWAVGWYARSAYFVGLHGEQVAIFRGRPGGLLWFDPTVVEKKAQPTASELLAAQRTELEAGHEVSSKAQADRFVNNLRQELDARRTSATTTSTTAPTSTTSTTRP